MHILEKLSKLAKYFLIFLIFYILFCILFAFVDLLLRGDQLHELGALEIFIPAFPLMMIFAFITAQNAIMIIPIFALSVLACKYINKKLNRIDVPLLVFAFFVISMLFALMSWFYEGLNQYYYNNVVDYKALTEEAIQKMDPKVCEKSSSENFHVGRCLDMASLKTGNIIFCREYHEIGNDSYLYGYCLNNFMTAQNLSKNICKNDKYDFNCIPKYCSYDLEHLSFCLTNLAVKSLDRKWCDQIVDKFVDYSDDKRSCNLFVDQHTKGN